MSNLLSRALQQRLERRSFLRRAIVGSAGVATILGGETLGSRRARALSAATINNVTDAEIFNFSLNFEYLGSQYYLAATGNPPLPASVTGTSGGLELPSVTKVPFESAATSNFALQLANDEVGHATSIREVIASEGGVPINQPLINLNSSWTTLAMAAGLISAGQAFDPFATEANFFVGAYVLEDVCVTALCGAAALITNPVNLAYAGSILGVEGYQVGLIRSYLSEIGGDIATDAISTLRATLANAITPTGVPDDVGTGAEGNPFNFTNGDINAQAFRRTPQQVLAIAYGTTAVGATGGGFFPNGANGTFTTT